MKTLVLGLFLIFLIVVFTAVGVFAAFKDLFGKTRKRKACRRKRGTLSV